jgi:hypothetical protein
MLDNRASSAHTALVSLFFVKILTRMLHASIQLPPLYVLVPLFVLPPHGGRKGALLELLLLPLANQELLLIPALLLTIFHPLHEMLKGPVIPLLDCLFGVEFY